MARGIGEAPQLKGLRERIERWRASRRGRQMPAELWEEAAVFARRLGVSHVATALGVGYASLKERAARAQPGLAGKQAGFVEVSVAQLWTPAASGAVTIELVRGETRLLVTVPSASGLDVAALVKGLVQPCFS